ncbi:hypothetical protein V498_09590 [Pseudogymnoascus sp. VKM F-4517 (FW-2822)]|nr:hypothetical protein V498_09590 [Pseudogymnoascus sp. VKM F-4517 (FW-2822)]
MKTTALAFLLPLGAAAAALNNTTSEPQRLPEGGFTPLQWTGQVEIGQKNVTLEGTAEASDPSLSEIYNQILAINPAYDDELGVKNWRELESSSKALAKRGDPINSASINCDFGNMCDPLFVLRGIGNLYAIGNGGCTAPAGWAGCARTQCYAGSSIWLCNDHPVPLTVPCKFVADNAQGLHDTCKHWAYDPPVPRRLGGSYYYKTNGQDTINQLNYYTILRAARLWYITKNDDYLLPMVPVTAGLSDPTEYIEANSTMATELRGGFNYMIQDDMISADQLQVPRSNYSPKPPQPPVGAHNQYLGPATQLTYGSSMQTSSQQASASADTSTFW